MKPTTSAGPRQPVHMEGGRLPVEPEIHQLRGLLALHPAAIARIAGRYAER